MDYGNAVSQKGYDVKTCADRFLVYSSAFQTLKIFNAYSVSTTIPASGVNTITITHNLGYYAPFLVIYNGSSRIGVGNSYFNSDSLGNALFQNAEARQYVNSLEIRVDDYFDDPNSLAGDTVYFTVYIFKDDFSTVSQQNINSGVSSGASSSDYGFRISKAGHDVKTCANKDCVISSSDFTHIVHKKGIDTSGDITVTISHNLGYLPIALAYTKTGSYLNLAPNGLSINTSNVNIVTGGSIDVYYIIFKDRLS